MQVVQKLVRLARTSPSEQYRAARAFVESADWPGWKAPHQGSDRTAYVIGLFGSGRWYINQLILKNIGDRAKNFRDKIRHHSRPTSMIYSGHTTMQYESRAQNSPEVTNRILEAVRSRYADIIFVHRHPLDSLLTNWIWWRTYLHEYKMISGISARYQTTDELCADLDRHFDEFKSFADGDPDFFAALPGPRFLSFPEFVEETELFLGCVTPALRLEDFTIDPLKEFSKIVKAMSLDLDLSGLRIASPKTEPYRYISVMQKVPRFRNFVDTLNEETKRRIEKIGYDLGAG